MVQGSQPPVRDPDRARQASGDITWTSPSRPLTSPSATGAARWSMGARWAAGGTDDVSYARALAITLADVALAVTAAIVTFRAATS